MGMKKKFQVGLFTPADESYPYDDVTLVNDNGGVFDAETPEKAIQSFTGNTATKLPNSILYQGLNLTLYVDDVTNEQYVAPVYY